MHVVVACVLKAPGVISVGRCRRANSNGGFVHISTCEHIMVRCTDGNAWFLYL